MPLLPTAESGRAAHRNDLRQNKRKKMKIEKLSGLIAAPHTPFDKNGEIAYDMIPRIVEHLLNSGVVGAYVSGTTGEGVSCSVEERIRVMDTWHRASAGRLKLIIHIGALSIADVRTLGRHANELGDVMVSVVPANYYKPANVPALVEFCRVAAASAPDCPFYYYHSIMSNIHLSMRDFLIQADGVIPNLAGIKFNSQDLYEYQNCLNALDGKYDIVYGVDEFFAGALALGAKALIGSTYNYAAPLYRQIWDDFEADRKDAVLAGMKKVCLLVDQLVKHGGIAGGKAFMLAHGLDLGDVRPPLTPLSDAAKREIVETYHKVMG